MTPRPARPGHCGNRRVLFADCTHAGEPGCAVQAAVEAGEIDAGHFDNYRKLREESAFYDLSRVERRHKDKAFGKFVKSAKKTHSRATDDD